MKNFVITEQHNVAEFMDAVGQEVPESPKLLDYETAKLRYNLIKEELHEFAEATGLILDKYGNVCGFDSDKRDLIATIDSEVDLLYVVYGSAVAGGVDLCEFWDCVNENNRTKIIDGYADNNGKWQKGPNYQKVDLKSVYEACYGSLPDGQG